MTKASDNAFPSVLITEGTEPSAPAAGKQRLYIDSTTHVLMLTNSSGTESVVGGSASGMATDPLWDTAGDLAVGSGANTAAKLVKGAAGGALSVINSVVSWNSGTSNPTAVTSDRYWRTDLGLEVYYDGTRWLTTQVFQIELKQEDAVTWPLTANASVVHRGTPAFGSTYDLYLLNWVWTSDILTTNDGTKYWTFVLRKAPPTGASSAIVSPTTAADTADTFTPKVTAINALLGTVASFPTLFTDATKTSTPGNARFQGGHITCRVVIT